MKRLIGVMLAALILTGCSKDVVVQGDSGVVNLGTVTAELASVKVSGKTGNQVYDLGTFPIASVYAAVAQGWASEDDTSLLQKDLYIGFETFVEYRGTKNNVSLSVNKSTVSCPTGFMLAACMTQIEAEQEKLIHLYREKFSYLK